MTKDGVSGVCFTQLLLSQYYHPQGTHPLTVIGCRHSTIIDRAYRWSLLLSDPLFPSNIDMLSCMYRLANSGSAYGRELRKSSSSDSESENYR